MALVYAFKRITCFLFIYFVTPYITIEPVIITNLKFNTITKNLKGYRRQSVMNKVKAI